MIDSMLMKIFRLPLPALTALIFLLPGLTVDTRAQNSDPRFLSAPEFVLSEEAVAAGIDGTFKAALAIDQAGVVTEVTIYGGPAWPCNAPEPTEIDAVRSAVRHHLMSVRFTPAMKSGKPRAAEVMLDFAIGEAFKRAVEIEKAKASTAGAAKVVKAGVINGKALRLAKPQSTGIAGVVTIQVLIDEEGNVAKAGASGGHRYLVERARKAACESKFSPTFLDGKPVKVTGVIMYNFTRG
jgi:hypothetical protein